LQGAPALSLRASAGHSHEYTNTTAGVSKPIVVDWLRNTSMQYKNAPTLGLIVLDELPANEILRSAFTVIVLSDPRCHSKSNL